MKLQHRLTRGFTIVELLIVIVVIAILAAISIVAYNGIQARAVDTSLKSDLRNATTQIILSQAENDTYPTSQPSVLRASNGNELEYTGTASSFCLSAKTTRSGGRAYNIAQDGVVTEGVCAGHSGSTAGGGSGMPGSTAEGWTAYNTPEQNGWTSAVYGNGRFIALATDGTNRSWPRHHSNKNSCDIAFLVLQLHL